MRSAPAATASAALPPAPTRRAIEYAGIAASVNAAACTICTRRYAVSTLPMCQTEPRAAARAAPGSARHRRGSSLRRSCRTTGRAPRTGTRPGSSSESRAARRARPGRRTRRRARRLRAARGSGGGRGGQSISGSIDRASDGLDLLRYSAKTSQPRYMNDSTASVTKAVACAASANVYGPGCTVSCEPTG